MRLRNALSVGAALSALATAAIATPTLAQDAAPVPAEDTATSSEGDSLGFDEIIVTASVRPTNKLQTSVSVSALDSEAVAEAAPRTTAEIFRQIPGIRSEATGGDGNANIAVRGLPVASGGAKFLQLQEDGMPVLQFGDISFGNADIFLRADQTVASIQAVRGGSASTLASNAPGGVINFISKDGSQEGGTVMATVGLDYEEYRLDFNYGASLGENTRFNVGGFWREGEGPRDAGYNGNSGYQIKANLTQEFTGGYVKLYAKHLDDHAIGYLPMPMLVTGSNSDPKYRSFTNFDILSDTPHSANFTSASGLDGNNDYRTTNIEDGMHPKVTSLGLEAQFEVADGLTIEERFRWSDVSGRFVSPFPSEIGGAAAIGNSVGQLLTGVAGNYDLVYANGPNAGQAFSSAHGLLMRTHLFNTEINDFGSYTNDIKVAKNFGNATLTAGFYKARQKIDMDWVWDSFLLEVDGGDGALVDVVDPVTGNVLTNDGLYAYGVPYWGNCCQRSYDATYDIDAPYVALNAELGGLTVDASMRYDNVSAKGSYAGTAQTANVDVNGDGTISAVERSVSLIDNANAMPIDYSVSYWSWSVGANYQFSPDAAVFARASRGGRANADRLVFGVVQADGSGPQAGRDRLCRPVRAGHQVSRRRVRPVRHRLLRQDAGTELRGDQPAVLRPHLQGQGHRAGSRVPQRDLRPARRCDLDRRRDCQGQHHPRERGQCPPPPGRPRLPGHPGARFRDGAHRPQHRRHDEGLCAGQQPADLPRLHAGQRLRERAADGRAGAVGERQQPLQYRGHHRGRGRIDRERRGQLRPGSVDQRTDCLGLRPLRFLDRSGHFGPAGTLPPPSRPARFAFFTMTRKQTETIAP